MKIRSKLFIIMLSLVTIALVVPSVVAFNTFTSSLEKEITDELKIVALNAMDKLSTGSSRYTVTSTCPEEPHCLMEDVLYSAVVRSH